MVSAYYNENHSQKHYWQNIGFLFSFALRQRMAKCFIDHLPKEKENYVMVFKDERSTLIRIDIEGWERKIVEIHANFEIFRMVSTEKSQLFQIFFFPFFCLNCFQFWECICIEGMRFNRCQRDTKSNEVSHFKIFLLFQFVSHLPMNTYIFEMQTQIPIACKYTIFWTISAETNTNYQH